MPFLLWRKELYASIFKWSHSELQRFLKVRVKKTFFMSCFKVKLEKAESHFGLKRRHFWFKKKVTIQQRRRKMDKNAEKNQGR